MMIVIEIWRLLPFQLFIIITIILRMNIISFYSYINFLFWKWMWVGKNSPYLDNFLTKPCTFLWYTKKVQGLVRKFPRYSRFLTRNIRICRDIFNIYLITKERVVFVMIIFFVLLIIFLVFLLGALIKWLYLDFFLTKPYGFL